MRHCVRHSGVQKSCSPGAQPLGLSAAGELQGPQAVWCVWGHLGSGGAQPDLTSQLIIHPTGEQQGLLCDWYGNLKFSSNRFFGLQSVLYSYSPSWNLLSQLVLISSGFGPRLVALKILQELGWLPSREDEDRCGLHCGLLGPGLWGTGRPRSCSPGNSWALSVLGKWCTGTPECLTVWLAVAGLRMMWVEAQWERTQVPCQAVGLCLLSGIIRVWPELALLLHTLLSCFIHVFLNNWVKCGLFFMLPGHFLSPFVLLGPFVFHPSVGKLWTRSLFSGRDYFLLDEKNKYSYDEMLMEKHSTLLKSSEFWLYLETLNFVWNPGDSFS